MNRQNGFSSSKIIFPPVVSCCQRQLLYTVYQYLILSPCIDINIPVRKGLLTWRSWGMKRLLACLSTQGRDHWRERKSLMSLFIWPTLLSWGWKSIGCISKFPTVPLNLSHKAGKKKESRVAVSTHIIIPRSNISRYYSITEITFVTEY